MAQLLNTEPNGSFRQHLPTMSWARSNSTDFSATCLTLHYSELATDRHRREKATHRQTSNSELAWPHLAGPPVVQTRPCQIPSGIWSSLKCFWEFRGAIRGTDNDSRKGSIAVCLWGMRLGGYGKLLVKVISTGFDRFSG